MGEMLIKYVSVAVMDQDGIHYSDEDERVRIIANELLIKNQNVVILSNIKPLLTIKNDSRDHVKCEKYWNELGHI